MTMPKHMTPVTHSYTLTDYLQSEGNVDHMEELLLLIRKHAESCYDDDAHDDLSRAESARLLWAIAIVEAAVLEETPTFHSTSAPYDIGPTPNNP